MNYTVRIHGALLSVCRNFLYRSYRSLERSGVPSDIARFKAHSSGCVRLVLKLLKRKCFFLVSMQHFLHCDSVAHRDARILWVNLSAPSIGDSLMDLSGRVLLSGLNVDLLTSRRNVELYKTDPYFEKVFSSVFSVILSSFSRRYEFVILDSFSPKLVTLKMIVAPLARFTGFYGYLNGFEVHRTHFSFFRVSEIFSLSVPSLAIVRPHLFLPASRRSLGRCPRTVAVALGGEWGFRNYQHWVDVIEKILDHGYHVSLVGSSNGLAEASKVTSRFGNRVSDKVSKCSLLETAQCIDSCSAFIGADGGLWHIACGLGIPNVVLFADCQLFDEQGHRVDRSTPACKSVALYSERSVSDIDPIDVVRAFSTLRKLHFDAF